MVGLDYVDINLVSRQVSDIKSRDEIDTSIEFCGRKLSVPIIASPMVDVTDGYFCKLLMDLGALGIIHRFYNIAEQVSQYRKAHGSAAAIGINGDWHERFEALYHAGCRIFCIDVANGASTQLLPVIQLLKQYNCYVIAGNTVAGEGYNFLADNGVDAVRVGVAGGAGCTTKNATGIYQPMVSLIQDTISSKYYYGRNREAKREAKIVADGGIREPQDFCKAIAMGADAIMIGSLLANTIDSPAERLYKNGKHYTIFRGSASTEIQTTYRDVPRYIEGKSVLLDYNSETIQEFIARFIEGLRSSMSYFNARTIKEYRENMSYVTLK